MKLVFEYDNFREFLRDFYSHSKVENKKFSLGYFSKTAGFKSRSVLRQVISGERNIASHSIMKFAKALKLNREETLFFRHLVLFNQAKTAEEKQTHAKELLRSRAYKNLHPLNVAQFNYYKHWYCIPIRELVGLPGFREDPEWIAKILSPTVSPLEAKKALKELLTLGLIKRGEDGKLTRTNTNISTGDEVTVSSFTQFHREMLKKASESIDTVPREIRDISAVTLTLSPENIKVIKEMIQKFRKDLIEVASRDHSASTVYQVGFQFFPLSKKTDEAVP